MYNYQDEEAAFIKSKLNKVDTWGKFLFYLIIGLILIVISFPFSSVLLLNPTPFTIMFSFGSLMILIAILQIVAFKTLINSTGSMTVLIVYFITLAGGIYAGLFHLGYFQTLITMGIQVCIFNICSLSVLVTLSLDYYREALMA